MKHSILLPFILLLFITSKPALCVECNSCNAANNMACYSSTQMQSCTNNIPSGTPISCPTNYVCTSIQSGVICQLNSNNVEVACIDCNKCDNTRNFACTATNTFSLCLNTTIPSTITGTCAEGLVCSIEYSYMCGSPTEGVLPSCSYADDVLTTTTLSPTSSSTLAPTTLAPNTNPSVYCSTIQQRGRFPYGTDPNTTCRQYIYCYFLNGNWRGELYVCLGQTYFDSTTQTCSPNLPARCTAAVASLRLQNINLN